MLYSSTRSHVLRTASAFLVLAVSSGLACSGANDGGPAGTPSGSDGGGGGGDGGAAPSTGSSAGPGSGGSRPDGSGALADGSATTPVGSPCGAADAGGALACDDFETGAAGSVPGTPWKVAKTGGSVTIDTTRAFSGQKSVKITAPAATGYRSVMLRLAGPQLPTSGNVVFGRMMFWLDSAPTAQVHWTFIDGAGLVAGTNYHAVYRYGGQLPLTADDGGFGGSQMMASYDTPDSYNGVGPGSDCYQHAQGRPVPVARWACAEWEFDGPNNTMKFWLDGMALPDLTVAATGDGCTQQPASYVWAAPTFAQIDVGWESYQADDARTLWLDDVAIGTTRIGCP